MGERHATTSGNITSREDMVTNSFPKCRGLKSSNATKDSPCTFLQAQCPLVGALRWLGEGGAKSELVFIT
ncbi:hypothetical protein TNCV_4763661 [Trichonephila clavipes]|nr:hypothetical protein TNCV_4763661 [Trichonephila clavipes]